LRLKRADNTLLHSTVKVLSKAHPLRPGLSVFARIDTGRPGRSMLEPYAATPPAICRTGVYDTRLDGVDALIDSIVQKNRLPAAAST